MGYNKFLHVGDILGAHGLKGTLSIYSHTRPASALAGYSCWRVGETPDAAKIFDVIRCWQHGKRMLSDITGICDCDSAETLKGMKIWIPASEVDTDEDEYLWENLIGCGVQAVHAKHPFGTVIALEAYGAQDNLVVKTAGDAVEPGEWLIPFTQEIVTDVDLEQKLILVEMPEGMDACFTPKF